MTISVIASATQSNLVLAEFEIASQSALAMTL